MRETVAYLVDDNSNVCGLNDSELGWLVSKGHARYCGSRYWGKDRFQPNEGVTALEIRALLETRPDAHR